jgi:hypothetical protein
VRPPPVTALTRSLVISAKRCSRLLAPLLLRCALGFGLSAAVAAAPSPGASAASANAASANTASASRAALQRQAIEALILRADADSLATAAALSFRQTTSPGAIELAVSASELAPQSAVIGWLHLQLCVETPACDFRDVATVLRWVDADNGASWLPILSAAYRDKDWLEVDRVIADMAQAKRFDLYWNPLVVLLADALRKARGDLPHGFADSDAQRLDLAGGIADEIVPPFATLLDSCRAAAAGSERREACLRLSRVMQRGDAVAAQMAGFGIEKHLVAPDSKEGRAMSERRHVLEWRAMMAARADSGVLPWLKNARARKRLAQMRAVSRQEDVYAATLREHRMALEPPEIHR